MKEVEFLVQGSAADPYVVRFVLRGKGNLSAYCTCQAAEKGIHCKHRIEILRGSRRLIVSGNDQDVDTIRQWMRGTDVEAALNAVDDAETALVLAKSAVAKAKKRLAQAMLD